MPRVTKRTEIPKTQQALDKALALKCFSLFALFATHDPDPNSQAEQQIAYNCENCSSYSYCNKLANTFKS